MALLPHDARFLYNINVTYLEEAGHIRLREFRSTQNGFTGIFSRQRQNKDDMSNRPFIGLQHADKDKVVKKARYTERPLQIRDD